MREKVTLTSNKKTGWRPNAVAHKRRKDYTMTNSTMTRRDFYNTIANTETLPEEIRNFATAAIQKLDETNAKRAAKPTKAAIENAPLVEQIVGMLGEEPKTASDLCVPMNIKVQKASALLRTAVKEGKAVSHDVKIKGKGTVKGYTKA